MSDSRLRGKVAVITGASSGIGRATALAFAREGASLVLAARRADALAETETAARGFGAEALVAPTDVADREQVRRLVAQAIATFGVVDVYVSAAGMMWRHPARDLKVEDVERVMAVNFYGTLFGILEVLPYMLERGSGHIVAVSSVDGKKGVPLESAYVASKSAVTGYCDVLRQELRGTGVHVSTVMPGRVDTPLIAGLAVPFISPKMPPELVARAIVVAALGRGGEVYLPRFLAKLLVVASTISPGFADWAIRLLRLSGWPEHPQEPTCPGRAR